MLSKQDQAGVRTPEDVLRRINISELNEALEIIERIRGEMLVDSQLSATSTLPVENRVITNTLNTKVTKVPGKGLSANDFTNEYKKQLDDLTTVIDLSGYAVSGLQVSNVTCTNKNNRVCIDFLGIIDVTANTQTIVFTLPPSITPPVNKNFLVIANSTVGYGVITSTGNITITYPETVNDKMTRFSVVYDLEEVEEE